MENEKQEYTPFSENEEGKKTFGAFICSRRKELHMTQKEFAKKLYVTDSAVSKWERGMSYPDITLLRSICQVLEISERELLTSSEDTQERRAEMLAKKYLRLMQNYRLFWSVLYGLTALGCAIGNIASTHTLGWFLIALTAEAMAASLTLLPALVPEGKRALYSLGGFTLSWVLLFLSCAVYTSRPPAWFFTAASGVLFGMWSVFGLIVLKQFPLPEALAQLRGSLYVGGVICLLLVLLLVRALATGGSWFPSASASILFGFWLVFGALFLKEFPLPALWRERKLLLYTLVSYVLLTLLYGAACLSSGGSWFVSASLWTLFGISVVLCPFLLRRQIPLKPHRALAYLSLLTILLLLGILWEAEDIVTSTAEAFVCLLPAWGLLLLLRYLPVGKWLRAGTAFLFGALYCWLFPRMIDLAYAIRHREYLLDLNSDPNYNGYSPLHLFQKTDLIGGWHDTGTIFFNLYFLFLLTLTIAGVFCLGYGILQAKK